MPQPQIVWLRRDLRLADQPAFSAAAARGPVIPVYVLDDETPGDRKLGGAARVWLHHALEALGKDLNQHRSRLVLRRGKAVDELCKIAAQTGAVAVHAIRHYEPWWRETEEALGERLELVLNDGNYLKPPGTVTTGSGEPYKIYSPFRDAMFASIDGFDLLPEPSLTSPGTWPASEELADLDLLPTKPDWAGGIRDYWQWGTAAALKRFDAFLERVCDYGEDRNLPSIDGSSRMSPHLHHGEVSPRMLWERMSHHTGEGAHLSRRADLARLCAKPYRPVPALPRGALSRRLWRGFLARSHP